MATEQQWSTDRQRFTAAEAVGEHLVPEGPLVAEFTKLTRALLDARTVDVALAKLVDAATELVPGADIASVTLRDEDGLFHTPIATETVAVELDRRQYETGEGPCFEAGAPDGPAMSRSDDLANDPRWPRFGPVAAASGVASIISSALLPDARPPRRSGGLNMYSRKPNGFDDHDADVSLLFATHASLALAHTTAVTNAELRATQLRAALDSRDVIGQAKGILMNRRKIGADEAFEILRRTSQDLNVKLADLATTLATRHTELDRGAR